MKSPVNSLVHSSQTDRFRGRGSTSNPPNRFERIEVVLEPEEEEEAGRPQTWFFRDQTRTVLVRNQSPDVGFEVSLNPYRGCEHGCAYCYARPFHEYLGFSAGLDFETRILVKEEAPQLLRRELASPRWSPQVIALSGVTDPYQPAERRFQLTRRCLEVLAEFRNPVAVVTKNHLVSRDADLLGELARHQAAVVHLSITTLDPQLQRILEPRASTPERRLAAIRTLREAGIPVGVMVAPVIPGLTDHEVPRILEAAAQAGASRAGYIALRLPLGVQELFESWLERHLPERKDRILNRVREIRAGKLNEARFHSRMRGEGIYWQQIQALFGSTRRRLGFQTEPPPLSTASFHRPGTRHQLSLFSS